MARHTTIQSQGVTERNLVIIVYEEGVRPKRIRKMTDGSYHIGSLHPDGHGYEWQSKNMEYVEGDKTE